jgi:hypothetical protein
MIFRAVFCRGSRQSPSVEAVRAAWHQDDLVHPGRLCHGNDDEHTAEPLLMRTGQSETPKRRGVGAQLVGDQQFWRKALLFK